MATDISWRVSLSASCLHIAEAFCRGDSRLDPELAAVVAAPAARLQRELLAAGFPEDRFWKHLVPLAGQIENNRQLVEMAVRKSAGSAFCSPATLSVFAGCVAELENEVGRAMPTLLDDLAAGSESIRRQWRVQGENLLCHIARLTDERCIVSSATVDLLSPALGGAGLAHLPYNTVGLEVIVEAPSALVPEVLRLAWLVSQLNIDLPMFSETIHPDRHAAVGEVAMIPVVLSAADAAGLDYRQPDLVAHALSSWCSRGIEASVAPATVTAWWDSYLDIRPRWDIALAALDRMIGSEIGTHCLPARDKWSSDALASGEISGAVEAFNPPDRSSKEEACHGSSSVEGA